MRSRIGILLGAAGCAALASAGVVLAQLGEGDPAARLVVPMVARDDGAGAPASPALAWSAAFDDGTYVLVAADDALVVAASAPVFPQFHEGNRWLVALDPASGGERWRLELACAPFQPVLTPEAVLFACDDGNVSALDREDGATRWRSDPGTAPFLPVVAGGLVLLGDADPEDDFHLDGSDPPRLTAGVVVALDAATGEEAWRVDTPRDGAFVTVAGEVAYLATYDHRGCDDLSGGEVIAVEAATGEERWRVPVGWSGAPVFAGDDGLVVAACGLFGLDPDGAVRWTAEVPGGGTWEWPLLADGIVVAGTNVGAIHGLAAATGTVAWTVDYCDCGYHAQPYPGGVQIDGFGGAALLDPASGDRRWLIPDAEYRPAVAGSAIFAGSHGGGALRAYR